MVRNTARNLLLATCIAAIPSVAIAQSPAQQRAPTNNQTTAQSGAQMSGKFLAAPQSGHMRAADLREADIYTSDNQKVGDIDDILLDSRGNIVAVVVGVGGFLGIGEKNVAIPFESLDIQAGSNAGMANNNAANTNANTAATRDRLTTGTNPNAITTPNSAMTDQERQRATAQRAEQMSREQSNNATAQPNQRMAQTTSGMWKPERILLKGVTKADLQNAPEFNWDANARTTNTPARNR